MYLVTLVKKKDLIRVILNSTLFLEGLVFLHLFVKKKKKKGVKHLLL